MLQPIALRSEAEHSLGDVGQRARFAVAIAFAAFVVLAREGGAPEALVARGFLISSAFFLAVLVHQFLARTPPTGAVRAAGVLADLGATTIAVALLADDYPLVPLALLWPVFTAGLVASTLYVLAVASCAALVLFAVVLSGGASGTNAFAAGGWGLLYFIAAFGYGEIVRQFRRAQRTSERAQDHASALAFCTSAEEVGELLFDYADLLLRTATTPATLLHDERGSGAHVAVAARGIDPEIRARLRLSEEEGADILALAEDGGMWADPQRLCERLAAPDAMGDAKAVYVVPVRDRRRVLGALLVAAPQQRTLSDEAQRGFARVASHAAASLLRLRAARLVEEQRAAMAFLLDVRRAGDDVGAIAAWGARAARDLASASGAALLVRDERGYRALASAGLEGEAFARNAGLFLDELFTRQAPTIVADVAADHRLARGALGRGAVVGVPVHGEGIALVVHDEHGDERAAGQIELLVVLADQIALLFARARALAHGARVDDHAPARIAELATRLHGPRAELEARVLEAFRLATEGNQPYLAGSGERVGRLAMALAEKLALDEDARDQIYVAAQLRDVGQLGIDRAIFERPRSLRPEEVAVVHQHPSLGESILGSLGFLGPAARIVRAHHERWDGTGYPDGIAGEKLPIGARILALADAYHAMTSERAYRVALSHEEAMRAIIDSSGHAFDPAVVEAFAAVVDAGSRVVTR